MYRFRSVENLIGERKELEKQQIYFADHDSLNDPMDGLRRYYWTGDIIVWENFLKHFLLCLEHVIFISRLSPDNETFTKDDIPILKSEKDLISEAYKKRIKNINEKFFSDNFVQSYMKFIIKNPNKIFIEEMYVHLRILSGKAIEMITKEDFESGLIPNPKEDQNSDKEIEKEFNFDISNFWDALEAESDPDNIYKQVLKFLYDNLKSADSELLLKYMDSPKLQNIYIEFTQMYLDSVTDLTYPRAYVACFMDNCQNSSIWGSYGNDHKGVCLKFKTDNVPNPVLPLKVIIGKSQKGYTYSYRNYPLQPIEYSSSFNELDFFRNIGRLPMQQLKDQWYTGENGDLSICSENIVSQVDEWRKQYWKVFEGAYLKKLPEWSHEREHRIILSSGLDTFSESKNRLLEYKFEDLEAIIFGMKTPKAAKMEIYEIVKRKCKELGRNHFNFYEMEYSYDTNTLYQRSLSFKL